MLRFPQALVLGSLIKMIFRTSSGKNSCGDVPPLLCSKMILLYTVIGPSQLSVQEHVGEVGWGIVSFPSNHVRTLAWQRQGSSDARGQI